MESGRRASRYKYIEDRILFAKRKIKVRQEDEVQRAAARQRCGRTTDSGS